MSRYSRHNPDAPISHDWTGGYKIIRSDSATLAPIQGTNPGTLDRRTADYQPDRRERVIIAAPYPAPMDDVCRAARVVCAIARQSDGWPVHHVTTRAQTFGVAT